MPNYPPGPKDAFFGFSLARRFRSDPLQFLTEVGRTYGDLAYFRIPQYAYIPLSGRAEPAYARQSVTP